MFQIKLVLLVCIVASATAASAEQIDPEYAAMRAIWAAEVVQRAKAGDVISAHPESGYVPTAEVAVAVGEAVLAAAFSESLLNEQKPFIAVEALDHWVVMGTPRPGTVGGVAHAVIEKRSGQVLDVFHTL